MADADTIWARIISPGIGDLSPETARYFLSLGLTEEDKARYQSLAELEHHERTQQQQADLEELVRANTVLMLFQAKARLSLKRQQPAA